MGLNKFFLKITFLIFVFCLHSRADTINRLVVPFPPGGSLDRMARILAPELAKRTNQVFIVENRPGGGGSLAAEYVRRSASEGKTLLMVNSYFATGYLQGIFNFDVITEFKPIIQLGDTETLLVARSDFSAHDLNSMFASLKTRDRKISCAGPPGQFLEACEFLSRAFPEQMIAVPFKGELPALQALMGGHLDIMFVTRTAAFELIKSKNIRLLAIAGDRRALPPFEDFPKLSDSLPGLELHGYFGVFAPVGIDAIEVFRLNKVMNEILRSDNFVQFMQASNIQPVGGEPKVMLNTFVQNVSRQKVWSRSRKH
jgi:tripartite-type tricarboxylate transporter receptor subunit TctC